MTEKNRPLYSPMRMREVLERHGFTFSKSLGQNFLIDGNILRKIATTGVDEGDFVLEIGPGFGVLTRELALRAKKVLAVEMDKRLAPVLEETLAGMENVAIHFDDVLKTDLAALFAAHFGADARVSLVANLPYYVTTPILSAVLTGDLPFKRVTVMVQKEVAERMVARPGTKAYGSLSVFVQYFTRPTLAFVVPPSVFYPRPKVSSAVVTMDVLGKKNDRAFFAVVRAAFGMRRKTLLNALAGGLEMEKSAIEDAICEAGLLPSVRGEALTMKDFDALARAIETRNPEIVNA